VLSRARRKNLYTVTRDIDEALLSSPDERNVRLPHRLFHHSARRKICYRKYSSQIQGVRIGFNLGTYGVLHNVVSNDIRSFYDNTIIIKNLISFLTHHLIYIILE